MALADAVAQMNRLHANDRVYVTLLDHAAQAALDARRCRRCRSRWRMCWSR